LLLCVIPAFAQQYDLLLKGGHVIDPKNDVNAVRDVAIKAGRIAAVGEYCRLASRQGD
jgi:dihydroorotase